MSDFSYFDESCEPDLFAWANDSSLSKYKSKRDFDDTPEPEGDVVEGENKHRFVIQRHKAKRAGEHFDLRLENDEGTMTSWAIPRHEMPKGSTRLLAVETENHPISYNKFEGEIPKGKYGEGKVKIHDSGTYEEIKRDKDKILFRLKGKKESGCYVLVRTKGKKWLLMEHQADEASDGKSKYIDKKKQDSGNVTYIYSEKHVEKRGKDKMKRLKRLSKSLTRLREKVRKDMKDDDRQTSAVALAVSIIDETYARVGNEGSVEDLKHYGLTTWRKKHISFSGGTASIKYVGKAGVKQDKKVTGKEKIAILKAMCEGKKANDRLFEGEGYNVKPTHVNAYLKPFNISAKDIRGLHANKEMIEALKGARKGKLPTEEADRKRTLKEEFKEALEVAAKKVGHQPGTLKNQYLIPTVEPDYMNDGKIGTLASDGVSFVKDMLPGGLGDNQPDSKFDEDQLFKGIEHEMEHTKSPQLAKEIAKDHLMENPRYYDDLKEDHASDVPSRMYSKYEVAYQENPKAEQKCSNCPYFKASDGCSKVEGQVKPEGWCVLWEPVMLSYRSHQNEADDLFDDDLENSVQDLPEPLAKLIRPLI